MRTLNRGYMTSFLETLNKVVDEVTEEQGDDKSKYIVKINPISIERIDHKPVPSKLLIGIRNRLGV